MWFGWCPDPYSPCRYSVVNALEWANIRSVFAYYTCTVPLRCRHKKAEQVKADLPVVDGGGGTNMESLIGSEHAMQRA